MTMGIVLTLASSAFLTVAAVTPTATPVRSTVRPAVKQSVAITQFPDLRIKKGGWPGFDWDE